MTVSYASEVATTSHGMSGFWKLLLKWRGSLYKLVWREFLVYAALYTALSLVYRLALSEEQKRVFEKITLQVDQLTQLIPMTFVLGFYVSLVMSRWWNMYISIPWPDSIASFISASIVGKGEKERVVRRTLMRYVNLTFALTLAEISPKMKKRAPTLEHFVDLLGLLTDEEMDLLKKFESEDNEPKLPIHWIPIHWATELGYKAREQELLKDDVSARVLGDKLSLFRGSCGTLLSFDYINIPLVYTQVVTIAVYTFFLSTLMGRQFLDPAQNISGHYFDTYVPVFTLLQFFFYMGWLKVAESLSNPFGEDDDDFDLCYFLDRNIKMSYMIVDGMHGTCPEPTKDIHFKDVVPKQFFYTSASDCYRLATSYKGSAHDLKVVSQDVILTDAERKWHEEAFLSTLECEESSAEVKSDEEKGKTRKPGDSGLQDDSEDSSVEFNEVRLQIGSAEDRRNKRDDEAEKEEDSKPKKEESQHVNDIGGELAFGVDFADGGRERQMLAPIFRLKPQNSKADRNGRRSYSIQSLRERRVAAAKQYRRQQKQQQEENRTRLNQTKEE